VRIHEAKKEKNKPFRHKPGVREKSFYRERREKREKCREESQELSFFRMFRGQMFAYCVVWVKAEVSPKSVIPASILHFAF